MNEEERGGTRRNEEERGGRSDEDERVRRRVKKMKEL